MSSKIEVCAEAEKAISALTGFEFKQNELQTCNAGDLLAVYLAGRAAAPVVERQPDAYIVEAIDQNNGNLRRRGLHWHSVETLKGTRDFKEWIGENITKEQALYTAPPELAELQATIAQLTAENERLLSGFWQQVIDEDLKKIADFVGDGDLPTNSFFMRKDAGDLANMAMHMVREVQALRIEIERLKGGQGEPVAWLTMCKASGLVEQAEPNEKASNPERWSDAFPVFASQTAPISVALDERAEFVAWVRREWPQAPLSNVRDLLPKNDPRYGEYCDPALQRAWVGWQARACIDKVKELNQ